MAFRFFKKKTKLKQSMSVLPPINEETSESKKLKDKEAKRGKSSTGGQDISLGTVIIIVISFVVLIITSSLGTYVAYSQNLNYANLNSEKSVKGTFTALIGMGVLMPILYFLFYYTKTTNNTGRDMKESKSNLLGVAYISFIFILLATSLGIWLCSIASATALVSDSDGCIDHTSFSKTTFENNPTKNYQIVFISFLVVGILLPILYSLFYFKNDLMTRGFATKKSGINNT